VQEFQSVRGNGSKIACFLAVSQVKWGNFPDFEKTRIESNRIEKTKENFRLANGYWEFTSIQISDEKAFHFSFGSCMEPRWNHAGSFHPLEKCHHGRSQEIGSSGAFSP
jgi:hypothetical protein